MPQTLDWRILTEFNPEPIESLRDRWQAAVAEEHKSLDPVEPKNVFDFFDGLRIIATLQRAICRCCGKERLHVMVLAMTAPGTLVGDRLRDGRWFCEFVAHARARLCAICEGLAEALSTEDGQQYRNPQLVVGGMLHWMFPCREDRHE